MALKDKATEDPVNTKPPANDNTDIQSDKAGSSDTSEIIYTPPSPTSSMTYASSSSAVESASLDGTSPQPTVAANISIREYIYFLPYPLPPNTPVPYSIHLPAKNPLKLPSHQFEPTSTLVLTSPKCTFVDLRFFKPFRPDQDALPNKGERERLEWAFAGTSESRPTEDKNAPAGEDKWQNVTHSTWTHWIDSRYPVGSSEIPVDSGDMYPISDKLTLEHGNGYQPLMKAMKTHEEMWRDVDVESTNQKGSKICVVLRLQADAAGTRGLIVRVGQYCQGMVMLKDYCTVERWEFDGGGDEAGASGGKDKKADGANAEEKTEAEQWKRTARVGDQFLPCAITFRTEVLSVGGKVRYHDYEWVVEEVWEWN